MTKAFRLILSALFTVGLSVSASAQAPVVNGCPPNPVPANAVQVLPGQRGWSARLASDRFAIQHAFDAGSFGKWTFTLVHYDSDPNNVGLYIQVPWWDRDERVIRVGLFVDGQVLLDDTSLSVLSPTRIGFPKLPINYRLLYSGKRASLTFKTNDDVILPSPASPTEIPNLADAAALFDTVRACRNLQ